MTCVSYSQAVVKFIKKSKMFEDSWTLDTHNTGRQIPLEVAILKDASNEYIIKVSKYLAVYDSCLLIHRVTAVKQFEKKIIMDVLGQSDMADIKKIS